jgi:NAD(P)-dependent dehydrogenase (short-subunit alcohol dehydrogenase family)
MVKFSAITQANARFASDSEHNAGLVCVFAGATSGIGAGTMERILVMLQLPTFYVLGRSQARFANQRAKLESLNPSLKLVFLETDISFISGVDAACKKILDAEQKVYYLFMSQGSFPINVPTCLCLLFCFFDPMLTSLIDTKEGIDVCFALQYYSRVRLTTNLLPLLRKSPRPRILSVLSGGQEKKMIEDDLGLQNPKKLFLESSP